MACKRLGTAQRQLKKSIGDGTIAFLFHQAHGIAVLLFLLLVAVPMAFSQSWVEPSFSKPKPMFCSYRGDANHEYLSELFVAKQPIEEIEKQFFAWIENTGKIKDAAICHMAGYNGVDDEVEFEANYQIHAGHPDMWVFFNWQPMPVSAPAPSLVTNSNASSSKASLSSQPASDGPHYDKGLNKCVTIGHDDQSVYFDNACPTALTIAVKQAGAAPGSTDCGSGRRCTFGIFGVVFNSKNRTRFAACPERDSPVDTNGNYWQGVGPFMCRRP